MKRKTNAFLLALYLFLSSSFYGCSKIKNNEDEVENEVISMEENKNETLEEIIEETIGTTIETIIPTEEIIETVPIETEPNVTEEVVIETEPIKTLDEIALEVIGNKYGSGQSRIDGVVAQGFDYNEVARRVDQILAGAPYSVPDRNTYYYNFAYAPYNISVYDVNGNVEGTLTQYQKVLILDEYNEYYFVSFYDQTFYVKKDEIKKIADSHLELDISEQKVYMYIDGELILEADTITGHPNKGTTHGTNLGISQVYSKSYDVTFEGGKQSKYFILFNWDGEGFHDANWREDWEYDDKERYIVAGSNGCSNMKEEDVVVIEQNCYIGMPVLIHK